jgi:hypothetical protein
MYGDTDAIRGLARTMRDLGAALRSEAADLCTRAEAVPWEGLAADAMRARVRAQTGALQGTADLADMAATALERHADEVDRRKALIAAIEHTAMALVSAAKDRLAGLIDHLVPDSVDEVLARFVPPPPGHRDWLTVDLPGLSRG